MEVEIQPVTFHRLSGIHSAPIVEQKGFNFGMSHEIMKSNIVMTELTG